MQTTTIFKTLGLAFGAMLLTACASKGDVSEGDSSASEGYSSEDSRAVGGTGVQGESLNAQANAALLETTVFYFGFDQSTLEDSSKNALKAHAAFLAANPSARVVLEGFTDERGTVEYNLALGERRAMSVRSFLLANGAKAGQLQVVSYGE